MNVNPYPRTQTEADEMKRELREAGRLPEQEDTEVVERSRVASLLEADLRKSRPFPTGTIIAWESVSQAGIRYSYAAVFASGHWYTTVERSNGYVQSKMLHRDLMDYFADRGDYIANLRVATDYEQVIL